MKKLLLFIIAALLWSSKNQGQSSNYTFSQFQGDYSEISGGILLGSESNDIERFVNSTIWTGGSNLTGPGYPIGFNFMFDGFIFDRIAINTNGWVSLGQSTLDPAVDMSSSSDYLPVGSTVSVSSPALVSRIVALGDDLKGKAGSELRIETVGTAPSRECVIQWKNYRKGNETGESYNFQIRLCETTNIVKIVYGSFTVNSNFKLVQTGIRGQPVNPVQNYHLRTTMSNWSSTTSGTLSQLYCMLSSTVSPPSGLTFMYSYVPDEPLKFDAVSAGQDRIYLNWTKNAGQDDIMVAHGTAMVNGSPVQGETYDVGSEIPGGGTVIYKGSADYFTHTGLPALTEHHYAAWSVSGGSSYSAPLKDSAFTSGGSSFRVNFDGSVSIPDGWTGGMTVMAGHGTLATNGLSVRMTDNGQANSETPGIGPFASPVLDLHYRLVEHAAYPASAFTPGTDDRIEVQVSTDDGANYTTVYTIDKDNHLPSVSFSDLKINLGSYSFTVFKVRFLITSPSNSDFYFDLDNISIGDETGMYVVSSSVFQEDTSLIFSGSNEKAIICLKVLTRNELSPLTLSSISFTTSGSTDPVKDIKLARVFYSTQPNFETALHYGDQVTNPLDGFILNPEVALSPGENYFWLVCDVMANAGDQDYVDATCTGFSVTDVSGITPFVTNPQGHRKIRQPKGDFYIPGDFPTVYEAVENLNGVQSVGTGGITFNVAAGHTETLQDFNGVIIQFTGTVDNPVTFRKSGNGANPLITAGEGLSLKSDGIIVIEGGDYITFDGIDLLDPVSNDDVTKQMEWGYALLKKQAFAPFNGCQNVSIRNCNITLQKKNPGSVGIYAGNHTYYSLEDLDITVPDDAMNLCRFYGNIISNVYTGIRLTGYNALAPYTLYDTGNEVGVNGSNTVTNFGGGTAFASGIYTKYQSGLKVGFNVIHGGLGTTSVLTGIWADAVVPADVEIIGNSISLNTNATAASVMGIINGCFPCFDSPEGTGEVIIRDNMISGCTMPDASSLVFSGIVNVSKASDIDISGNTIGNNILAGTGGFTGVESRGGANVSVHHNIVAGNRKSGAAGWMNLLIAFGEQCDIYSNQLYDNRIPNSLSSFGPCDVIGIDGSNSVRVNIYDNAIYDLSVGGTSNSKDSDMTGIQVVHHSILNQEKNIYHNQVHSLNSSSGTTTGIFQEGGNITRIHENEVYELSGNQSADMEFEPPVTGILCHRGAHTWVYNNFISDLRAPFAMVDDAIRGIAVTSDINEEDTVGIYHNTVYLDASSSGADFGSSGIYQYSEIYRNDVPKLDLRNNIIVNTSVPNGSGRTVAFRRSVPNPFTSLSELSGNNIYYAGNPGPANLIFSDGTNEDQTLETFQTRVSPREGNSVSVSVPFLNIVSKPYDLHIDTTANTAARQGGTEISGTIRITSDIDGEMRNMSTPDIGADEFSKSRVSEWNRWLGVVSTEWHNAENWSAGIPEPGSDVSISKSGLPLIVEMSEDVGSLVVEDYGVLIVSPVGQLTVNGKLENHGTLLLKSYSGSTGSLIHDSEGVTGKVECYVQGDHSTDSTIWRLLSSPVESQEIASFLPTETNGGYMLMGLEETSGNWYTYGVDTGFTRFVPGIGYAAWWEETQIPVFEGILHTKDIVLNGLTCTQEGTGGWHLLGNPFSSAIAWNNDEHWSLKHVAAGALVWNENNKSFGFLPQHGIIPPMQGFLVQTLQDAASLTIPSSARLHSNEQGLPGGYEGITLAAKNVKNQSVQESILRFDPSSTQGYDPAYDVRFMEGYAPGFFSVEGEDHLLVNTFPEMSETLEIPYGFYAFEPGSYTIELVSSLPGLNLYLNDHKTMTEHHLTIPESYTFVWEPGDELQRFVLSFKESGINGQETEKFPELKAWAVKGRLMISSNAPATEIEIINMYGQLCYRENILNRGTFEIPVMLETGIYLVRMSAGQAMRTVKIMLQ